MAVTADPRIGSVLAGYRIEARLGRGGMGVVYLAEQLRLKRKVALKLVAPELAGSERFRERLLRESELAASIDHPNVLPIYDAAETDGVLYVAMRYVEGTDLRRLLDQEGHLEPARAIGLLAQVAEALDVAHEHGLVHRDVKPANVLIATQAGREHIYLADFGLSRQIAAPGALERSHFSGTVAYAAPEQVRREPVDGRADLYALACVLQECLTGQPPFPRESLPATLFAHLEDDPPPASDANPELAAAIDPVLATALAKEPRERQESCREMIDQARHALGIATPRTGWRQLSRRTKLATALAAAAIAVAATVPALLLTGDTKPAARPLAATAETKPTLAITADSIQHVDPGNDRVVSTTRIGEENEIGDRVSQISVGEGAAWVTLQLWHADTVHGASVVRLDPRTGAVTGHADAATASDVAPGRGAVWVVNNHWEDSTLSVIDPKTLDSYDIPLDLHAAGPIAVGQSVWVVASGCTPSGVFCPPDDSLRTMGGLRDVGVPCCATVDFPPLYVRGLAIADGVLWLSGYVDAGSGSGQLKRVDETTQTYLDSTRLDFVPAGGLAAGDGAVWIVDPVGDRLVRIDAETRRVVARIPVGHNPLDVAVGAGAVWVTNYDDRTVSRIDPSTNQVVATIEIGPRPDHIAADETGVWVAVHAE